LEAGEDLTKDARTNIPVMGSGLLAMDANWGFVIVPQVSRLQILVGFTLGLCANVSKSAKPWK
jgi:hypothetical protein